jgi:hypothetical protein
MQIQRWRDASASKAAQTWLARPSVDTRPSELPSRAVGRARYAGQRRTTGWAWILGIRRAVLGERPMIISIDRSNGGGPDSWIILDIGESPVAYPVAPRLEAGPAMRRSCVRAGPGCPVQVAQPRCRARALGWGRGLPSPFPHARGCPRALLLPLAPLITAIEHRERFHQARIRHFLRLAGRKCRLRPREGRGEAPG